MTKELAVALKLYTTSEYWEGTTYGEWSATYEYSGCSATLGGSGALGYNTEFYDVRDEVEELTPLWIVVAIYATGNTFGRSNGNAEVVCVCYSAEDGEKVAQAVRQDYQDSPGKFGEIKVGDYSFYNGTWKGYFESLEDVIVERVRVEVV